jgi:hypothetical protein
MTHATRETHPARRTRSWGGLAALILAFGLLPLARGAPLGAAFTYQGQLQDGGVPASGAYDFQFKLFDAATAGAQIGSTVLKGDVGVAAGQFTVSLDFGATAFAGQSRFLEIGVRPGASTGAYTLLGARQELTPSPNALFATSAASATTVAGLTCTTNQVAKWSGSAWTCGADSNGGGTVTSVAAGSGLSGGPITGTGTLSVATGGITSAMIANGAVGAAQIESGAVGSAQVNTAQVQARVTSACPPGLTIQTINTDGTVVCQTATAQAGFSTTTLDSAGNVGTETSITRGADGLGLISYRDATNSDLKVAHCSNAACTTATITTLDSTGDVGGYTSITTGADGFGLISYFHITNQDLKVAHCSNAACTTATITTLDSPGGVGAQSSITIGADGLGLISYWDFINGYLKVAHCSNAACTTATISTLDSMGGGVGATSITTGADGLGLISYFHYDNFDLKVAHCSNAACTTATITTLDGAAVSGADSSITTGADGLGLISYREAGFEDLKVAHCSNAACTTATITTLDSTGQVGGETSITRGADGLGLISYRDYTNQDLRVAHCSNATCTTATISTLDSTGSVGADSSITIGADGLGLISYWDSYNGDLKVAHCPNLECRPAVTTVAAGSGLMIDGNAGNEGGTATLSVAFGGGGGASTVARSDHDHFGQSWSGTPQTVFGLAGSHTAGSWFNLGNTSAGGKPWNLISTGSASSEGAGKLLMRSGADARVVMTLQGDGNVGIGTSQPAAPLDLSYGAGAYRLQFRYDSNLVPGMNLTGPGGNAGILRLRRKMEIWPNDAATSAGALDIRNTAGAVTIDLNGATGSASFSGTVSKGGGSFKIDHPLDPENKFLYHSFVESPDMMNLYNGNVTTDEKGYATVIMPAWFQALNRDFRYQLTIVDDGDTEAFTQAKVVRKMAGNQFTIRTNAPSVEVSWLVTGIRQDAFANANRIPLEEMKPADARGTYLHAAAFGKAPKN